MGVDISSDKGFLLPLTKFLQLIKPAHLEAIKTSSIRLFRQRVQELDYGPLHIEEILSAIESSENVDAICVAIVELLEPYRECIDDGFRIGETSIGGYEIELLQCISRVILPITPSLFIGLGNYDMLSTDSPCVSDNEIMLVFDFEQCFETRMTNNGKSLSLTLGQDEIIPSFWATWSN